MEGTEKSAARARVTISIKKDILAKVDSIVDGLTIRSRSQAFEFLLTKILGSKVNIALVLAGGTPKSIKIGNTTKFLARIGTKSLLETTLEHLHSLGINRFIVYVDYKAKEIIEYFNARSFGYSIHFITGKKATGTAEPLLKAKPFLKDTFLLAYGDTICRLNLSNMYAFHKDNSSIATVALTSVDNPRKYGIAIVEGAKIKNFSEKPRQNPGSYFINAGYFIFEPEVFAYVNKKDRSLERDILPRLAQHGMLFAYPFQGLYLNINRRADLERARTLLQG